MEKTGMQVVNDLKQNAEICAPESVQSANGRRVERIKINGKEYPIGPWVNKHAKLIKAKHGSIEHWVSLLGNHDPEVLVDTIFMLLQPETREEFPSIAALDDVLPADQGYQMVLTYKILRLYGQPLPSMDEYDMENMGSDEQKKLMSRLLQHSGEMAEEMKKVQEATRGMMNLSNSTTPLGGTTAGPQA